MADIDDSALDLLANLFDEDEIKSVLSEITVDLTKYQKDPIGFLENELGIKNLYGDLKKVCNSVRDNKITVAKSGNGPGKTFISAALSVWMYLCFPNSQVICACAPPEENLKQGLFAEISNFYYKFADTLFKNHVINVLQISPKVDFKDVDSLKEVNKKHFIIGRTIPSSATPEKKKAAFSGKHAEYQLFIVDEADGCPDEIFEAIDGCLSGDHVRLLLPFNPRRKEGYVYNLIKNADEGSANVIQLSALNHPNVVTGKNLIPGAVSRDKTIQRIYEWTEELPEGDDPDLNCFEIPKYLVGAIGESSSGKKYPPLNAGWRRIKNSSFPTIVLGEYPSITENCLISEIDFDNAVTRYNLYMAEYGKNATDGLNCVLGMDVADEGGDNCAIVQKYGNLIKGFVTWKGVDTDKSADKLAKLYCDLDAFQANIESDGIGAAIPPKVSRMFYWKCENKECKGFSKTYLDDKIWECPICHKELIKKHFNVKKIYVSAPSNKKCDMGKFHLLRDELAWEVAEWLKKEPSAMLPYDKLLKEEMLAYEWYEDPSSGKIKVSDKKTIKKKIGRSDDRFASLRQAFYKPAIPHIRVI